jgi:hypothetical protein
MMMEMKRVLGIALVALALTTGAACSSGGSSASSKPLPAQWGALKAEEQATYEYIVPYGTSVRIDQGQKVDLMPQHLDVKVGESIRIKNQDSRDYMIGPFFVTAGQSLAMRFTHAGQLSGACSMNPEGEFIINVA